MKQIMVVVALHAALLVACTEVPGFEPGVCGNRIVDLGEDCDGYSGMGEGTACGDPATSNACFFVCDVVGAGGADGTARVCPEGWGCGQDGRCRQPSGQFDADSNASFRFPAESLAIGDLDGDGFPDIVGTQGSQLSVRFGSESGVFSSEVDVPVPQPAGLLTFGLFNGDALLDIILPISGGLVPLLGREDRKLETVAYSSLDLRTARFGVRALVLETFPGDQNNEILGIVNVGMRFFDNPTDAYVRDPLGDKPLDLLVDELAVGDVDGDGSTEFALAFAGERTVHLCRGNFSGNDERTMQPICFASLATGAEVQRGGTRLVDVDGDDDLDLLAAVSSDAGGAGGAAVAVEIARNRGDGSFDGFVPAGTLADRQVVPGSSNLCERIEIDTRADAWPLAAADFNKDGRADYVFASSIAIARFADESALLPSALVETACLFGSRWKAAVITDINGDDWLDVAVDFEANDGIDIYLNAGEQAGGEVFNVFHVSTDSPPLALRSGDFDGDRVRDIAFYERVGAPSADAPLDRVSVIFGSKSGSPSAPVAMGTFYSIEVFEPLLSPFVELNGRDFIDDLVVVSLPPGSEPLPSEDVTPVGTILQGDSSRRMLSPIFLVDGDGNADRFLSSLLGNFASDASGIVRDIAVIAEREFLMPDPDGGSTPVSQKQSRLWLLQGTDGSGGLGVPRVSAELPPTTEYFDYTCALWITGNIDPERDDLDEVIGIDGNASCASERVPSRMVVSKFPASSGDAPLEEIVPVALSEDLAFASSLTLRDLDGDGAPDILVLFSGRGADQSQPPGRAALEVLWNSGGGFSPGSATRFEADAGERMLDVAPLQMAGDAVPELAVLTDDRVFVLALDADSRTYGVVEDSLMQVAPAAARAGNGPMRASDVNGDGLDDVVVRTIVDASHAIRVALQVPRAPLGSAGSNQEEEGP